MPPDVPDHRHCQMCGKPIPIGEVFCSKDCKERFMAFMRKRKILIMVTYLILIILFIVIVLSTI